jgi:hypothetical protein
MNRDYVSGKSNSVDFFVGAEVELTPAHGKKTLFVVGLQPVEKIKTYYYVHSCEHIFFGANHSFDPPTDFPKDAEIWEQWENTIEYFLKKHILCSLDIPVRVCEALLEAGLVEYHNFIPQIRIPVPYVKQWNYNTMLKIDDRDFQATNPGVWCHSLHDLMDRNKFTDWNQYKVDTIIE